MNPGECGVQPPAPPAPLTVSAWKIHRLGPGVDRYVAGTCVYVCWGQMTPHYSQNHHPFLLARFKSGGGRSEILKVRGGTLKKSSHFRHGKESCCPTETQVATTVIWVLSTTSCLPETAGFVPTLKVWRMWGDKASPSLGAMKCRAPMLLAPLLAGLLQCSVYPVPSAWSHILISKNRMIA